MFFFSFLCITTIQCFSFQQLDINANASTFPKTILFSASPDQILNNAQRWKEQGVDAFFLDYVAREWSDNIWATDKKPWTIGKDDETFQKASQANTLCKSLGMETYLKISFDHHLDWFNDIQWENVLHNFRQFGIFAKQTGCTGFAIDIEYIGEQYNFDWEGYKYDDYTRKDLVKKVRERSADIINTVYSVFPDMVFLTFPEQGPNLGLIIQLTWIEELAKKHAAGGLHYCIEHTYRLKNPKEVLAYIAGIDQIFLTYLSPQAKKYWKEKCSVAPGIWPFGFDYDSGHKSGYTVDELKEIYALHIATSPGYNWIYSHNCYEQLLGRQSESFESTEPLQKFLDVLKEKKKITDPFLQDSIKLLRERDFDSLQKKIGFALVLFPADPYDNPRFQTVPIDKYENQYDIFWKIGEKYLNGEEVDFQAIFHPITKWKVAGPFHSGNFEETHKQIFSPETDLNFNDWKTVSLKPNKLSINFIDVFGPQEESCGYATCTFEVSQSTSAQIRFGFNDAVKVWLIKGTESNLIYDYFGESSVVPDKVILPVSLEPGVYRILTKVTNNKRFWGFTLRLTDEKGNSISDKFIKVLD